MPFIGNQPALAYTSFAKQDFTTSATTSYTLDNPVANANELALFINFVRQEPTTAYSASGTSLVLTSATASSDDMYCVYLGKAVQTVNPPSGSVGASQLVDSSIALGKLSATGTKDATTFLRGDNTFASAGGDNTPAFAATLNGTQAISNGTHTVIAFANELYDTNNAYDNSAYRFTVPSGEAGTYYLKLSGYINSGDDFEPVNFQIKKNGSDMIYAYGKNFYYNTFSNSITIALSVGDYIEALVFQSSGSSKNLVVDTNNYFCGHKLIGV